jgi:hypothetical protein
MDSNVSGTSPSRSASGSPESLPKPRDSSLDVDERDDDIDEDI